MDRLWAPWRINYIRQKKQKGCIFCLAAKSKKNNYVVFKTEYSIVLLNKFPYNNGHLMISPLRHTRELSILSSAEILDLFSALNKTQKLLKKVLGADSYNIGINIGRPSGAGITGHLHIHILPRWVGDANFMPLLNDTKIISQSLDELHKLLKNAQSK